MTKQEQIAEFLNTHIVWPRIAYGFGLWDAELPWGDPICNPARGPRPSVDELARELLGIAEFRALQLGTWFSTTDGQVIAEAVEMVTPPFYSEDVELLVAALQRAAQLQQVEGQQAAGRNALVAIGVAALVALFVFAIGEPS